MNFFKTQIPGALPVENPDSPYLRLQLIIKALLKLCILICIIFTSNLFAQVPTLEWTSSYYNPQSFSYSMSKDPLGNIFICGYQRPYGFYKYLTLKFSSNGNFNWAKIYHTGDSTTWGIAEKCIADGVGNVYVGGTFKFENDDIFIIKYNNIGDSIWSIKYNGSKNSNDQFADMVIDKFKNIYVTGMSAQFNTGFDFLTLKYDSAGTLLWSASYNNILNSTDEPQAIALDSMQNVYVTGYGLGSNFRNEYITVKYNSSGVEQWAAKHNSGTGARAYKIGVDRQNNIYVAGMVDSISVKNHTKYRTVKYDQNGNILWYKDFNSMIYYMNIPYNLVIDELNSPIVVGTSITKYSSSGSFLWADTISPGYSCDIDELNNLYVFGGRADTPNYLRTQTIKYSIEGSKMWTINLEHAENQVIYPSDIIFRNNKVYLCTNFYQFGKNQTDTVILYKYSVPVGIANNNNELPEYYELFQNYPNPFNPKTLIKYDIAENGFVKIVIYDLLGRVVKELVNNFKSAGTYSVEFDGTNLATGVYIYRLKSGNFVGTKKMVLIK